MNLINQIALLSAVFASTLAFGSEIMVCDVEADSQKKIQITHDNKQVLLINTIQTTDETDGNLKVTSEVIFSRTYENPLNRGGYKVSYCNPDDSTIYEYNKNMRVYSNCMVDGTNDQVHFSFSLQNETKSGKYSINYMGESVPSTQVVFNSCK